MLEVVSTLNYLSVKVPTILDLRELHLTTIVDFHIRVISEHYVCLLYTSDAADDWLVV